MAFKILIFVFLTNLYSSIKVRQQQKNMMNNLKPNPFWYESSSALHSLRAISHVTQVDFHKEK